MEENKYDVIYNSFVLEHIDEVERVLNNFWRWLRPGGILILRIPNRDSVYGFLTSMTPFWVHIFYKKYIRKNPNAGNPGYGPFLTFHDKVVSRNGIHKFCKKHGLIIKAEYGSNYYINRHGIFSFPIRLLIRLIYLISLGKLAFDHNALTYVIEKT